MRTYFAYGSNLWEAQMRKRCPECRQLGRARLPGHRWIICTRGYATVVPDPGEAVEGVLYALSPSDEAALDVFEHVPEGWYAKFDLPVETADGRSCPALVYVDTITEEGRPKEEYVARINAGLRDAQLPSDYVTRVIRRFIPE